MNRQLDGAGLVGLGLVALLGGLAGCGGGHADVEGTVLGIPFGSTRYVFFGGPFIAISNVEVDCKDLYYVRRSYESGSQPTTADMQMLQFAYVADTVEAGQRSIDIGASVSATVVKANADNFEFSRAQSGVINVEDYEDEKTASGTFDGVTFDDGGSLSGSFTAEWCQNLRDR